MDKKLIVALLAVVVLVMAGPGQGWPQKAPIRIGFLAPVTGGGTAVGKDMTSGFTMYLEEIGNQIAGRKGLGGGVPCQRGVRAGAEDR